MYGVTATNNGLPATAVFRLSANQPVQAPQRHESDEVILAAVTHPPRVGEVRPLAALLPDVLAKYGLTEPRRYEITKQQTLDVLA